MWQVVKDAMVSLEATEWYIWTLEILTLVVFRLVVLRLFVFSLVIFSLKVLYMQSLRCTAGARVSFWSE